MSADGSVSAIILPPSSHCSAYLDVWRYKPAFNEIVDWSIAQSCAEYEQREYKGTAKMAELNAVFQTRQEERYVISLSFFLLGGSFP